MGYDLAKWADAAGPIYMGGNSSWESIWTWIAIAVLVLCLIVGIGQEKAAYRKSQR